MNKENKSLSAALKRRSNRLRKKATFCDATSAQRMIARAERGDMRANQLFYTS